MAITFKDVAKLAGVSTQTVSRVINGSPSVTDATRESVNQAIKALGYIPNKNAQILSRNQSNVIGIISLDFSLHGVALTTNGIRKTAKKVGYATAFSISESINFESVKQSIHELLSQKVDGIVINIPLDAKTAELIQSQYPNTPIIFIEASPDAQVNMIYNENHQGALLAAEHLIAQNRKRFLLITGDAASTASKIRLEAWINCLKQAEVHIVKIFQGDWKTPSGYLSIKQAIASKIDFDAILCANDQMALGALCALNESGFSVPKKISIMGFDDTQDSIFFTPPLSTIKQNFEGIGHASVLQLIKLIEEKIQFKEWIQHPQNTTNGLSESLKSKKSNTSNFIKESIAVELIVRESSINPKTTERSASKEQLIDQIKQLHNIVMNLPE
ncbi:LacI family DNA-binding transcriptional regulator [Thorsellia kenyensis]|uniref:LacI family DNA-binding transcriptional regulator n=1 Tax=Thorsellia kenyensis TaxID=1549888 RepID=A0ABV6CFT6_9GAMM